MAPPIPFSTRITLIACFYAVLAGVMVIGLGRDLGHPVSGYAPQVSWLLSQTTDVRMIALQAAGRGETAALYALVAAISWGLIGALTAGGFAWGVFNKGETVLGVDKALSYLAALSALYALATATEMMLTATHLRLPQGGLHAMPALWFATMIPSAAILSRIGALIGHDFGSLLAIALTAEPTQRAALLSTVEARRGSESLEARLARYIARGRG